MQMMVQLVLWCLLAPTTFADTVRFHVVDAQGNGLENAVIMLPGTRTAPSETIAVMDQVNKTFVPHVLVIQPGQHVLFPNSDNIRHHVYSFSPAKPFEIKLYAGVPEEPIPFENPGVVVLGCNIHDTMVGYIVVADTPQAGKTDAEGNLTLDSDQALTTLRIWHPYLASPNQQPATLPFPAANAEGVRIIALNVTPPAPAPSSGTFGNRFKRNYGQ